MSRLQDRYNQLVAQGWTPALALPFVDVPVGDGVGTWFTYHTASGVNVAIYDHPDLGAFEVHGSILASYQAQGGPLGSLGYPTSDEHNDYVGDAVVGRVSDFMRGSIFWSSTTLTTNTMIVGPVTGGEFETFDGVDVSAAQGTIDWARVAGAGGQQFAYIKATETDNGTDPTFVANWNDSRGRLPRGAYHAFHARASPEAARRQADHFVDTLTRTGDVGELPPTIDVELDGGVTQAQRIASLQFCLSIVEQSLGRRPLIYTYPSFWQHQMGNTRHFATAYRLWIANYGREHSDGSTDTKVGGPVLPGGWSDWAVWQHAKRRGVAGIAVLVDRDFISVPLGTSLVDYLN